MSPLLSIETVISAMMCLCSSNNSGSSSDFYSSLADKVNYNHPKQSVVLVQREEIKSIKDKIETLELKIGELQEGQRNIVTNLERTERTHRMLPKVQLGLSPQRACPRRAAAAKTGENGDEIFMLVVPASIEQEEKVFQGLCTRNGWLVVQQRFDGSVDFLLPWREYKRGFGTLNGEFFIGLERLHALTAGGTHDLLVELEDFENDRRIAAYRGFEIGNETEGYALKNLGEYQGTAGDSLRRHMGSKFTTRDVDNDDYDGNCATDYTGAWWYDNCLVSNLNGQYLKGPTSKEKHGRGMSWQSFRGLEYSLKSSRMMIRSQDQSL